jgi:ribosomal protein S18 acetylase RimI-like enzyme
MTPGPLIGAVQWVAGRCLISPVEEPSMLSEVEIISAARRSDQAWCEQVCQWESLGFGVAYFARDFPSLAETQQLRDVWLNQVDPQAAYEQTETFFHERELICSRWALSPEQDVQQAEALLVPLGWKRRDWLAMGLARWDSASEEADESIRILPARAMPKAYRQSLAESASLDADSLQAGFRRLDDANYDPFVAVVAGEVAGRSGYLEVGDIARLEDLTISEQFRGRGVDRALVAHFLRTARRLLPRAVVARVDAHDEQARTFLQSCGFSATGTLTHFHRHRD